MQVVNHASLYNQFGIKPPFRALIGFGNGLHKPRNFFVWPPEIAEDYPNPVQVKQLRWNRNKNIYVCQVQVVLQDGRTSPWFKGDEGKPVGQVRTCTLLDARRVKGTNH